MDIIKLDVPLLDVKQDADLHDVAEAVIELSQEGVVTMADYASIVGFMKQQGNDVSQKLDRIKQLGGMK